MTKNKVYLFALLIVLLTACATIPSEAVKLSSEVGIGLQKQHQSQIDLINLHFSTKRKRLDEAMARSLNSYFEALTPNGSITLDANRLGDVADDVILINHKNNAAKEELEKARVYLIGKLSENYSILNQANASVTGLLRSAVVNKEARSETYEKLSKATAGGINLNNVFAELDNFVEKNGEQSGKAINLVEKFESALNKETDK
ncbi:MAG: hypothetical protein L3J84_01395 [Gammaproteobacteria bacterium]|nr:hypothetical protein [Gammaproteobacteria bacterium]